MSQNIMSMIVVQKINLPLINTRKVSFDAKTKLGTYWSISTWLSCYMLHCLNNADDEPRLKKSFGNVTNQLTFTCPKSTIETLEKFVKYVQS